MTRSPSVRVSAARDLLAFADKFQEGTSGQILQRFPPEALDALQTSPRSSWLSIEHDHFLVDGLIEVLGRERAIQCWRASMPDMIDKPLLRSFASGMMRLFGRDPTRVIGLLPKGWPLVFNDFCTVKMITGPGDRATLLLEGMAPQLRKYPNYFHSWDGICQGIGQIACPDGRVYFSVARDMSSAEAKFDWG
jgi:hypothetical protein